MHQFRSSAHGAKPRSRKVRAPVQPRPPRRTRIRASGRTPSGTAKTTSTPATAPDEIRIPFRETASGPGRPHAAATVADGKSTRSSGGTRAARAEPAGWYTPSASSPTKAGPRSGTGSPPRSSRRVQWWCARNSRARRADASGTSCGRFGNDRQATGTPRARQRSTKRRLRT